MMTPASLIGAWTLVEWTIRYADGRTTMPFGPTPRGQILYLADGYMSATMMKRERAGFRSRNMREVTDEERARAFDGYLHYAGRWHVEGEDVIHDVDLAMNPLLIGTRQVRRGRLDGECLELRAEEAVGDPAELRVHRIVWRRAGI